MKVQIYDQEYSFQSDQQESYVRKLAAYVDGKMHSVAESAHAVDTLRVAVLAAINIADELFTLRGEQQLAVAPLRERLEKCVEMVDEALRQTS